MVKARLANARQSTAFRSTTNLRIDNREGTTRRRLNLPDEEHAYGMPLRASTPIREVMGNYYGELAEGEMMCKYDEMRNTRERFVHTAKSGMRTTKHTVKSKNQANYISKRGEQY